MIQLVKVRGSGDYLLRSDLLHHFFERAFDMSLLLHRCRRRGRPTE